MILEEVARHSRPLSGSPDTEVSWKIFKREPLVENLSFVSGEHDTLRGGTT